MYRYVYDALTKTEILEKIPENEIPNEDIEPPAPLPTPEERISALEQEISQYRTIASGIESGMSK